MQFYEELAAEYDAMTQFEARFEKERGFFEGLKQEYGLRKVLDAGCGTGFHSVLLAKLGLEVTGIDSSTDMLKKAGEHIRAHNVDVRFQRATFQDMGLRRDEKFDAVVCMGNSLPHLHTEREIVLSLKNFYNVLNDKGIVVIQNLNYDRIMRTRERIVSVKKSDGTLFVRFYDFGETNIVFHILVLKEQAKEFTHKLLSTVLRPIYQDELLAWFGQAGFQNLKSLGNMAGEKFSKETSRDLIVVGAKAATT
ncbi:MAG: class I SAM-dependent methyltransferase [Gemmatimonadota bacterium]|nr:MAG: class I SAM-dependent methyltransferase [Gemmatimonadota bacterium]